LQVGPAARGEDRDARWIRQTIFSAGVEAAGR
jgi:hypothetical protein